eukprot:13924399-Ditylum_brightwellii.AAC.1
MVANRDQLKVPLHQWLVPTSDLQRHWLIHLDYNKEILYVRLANKFCQYSPYVQNSHIFTSGSDTEWILTNTSSPVPATSIDGAQSWVLTRKIFYTSIPVSVSPIISTFKSHLNTLQEWEQMLLQNMECHEPIHHIAQLMTRPTTAIIVASDGLASKQKNTMPFGWVISLLDSMTLATHTGPAFGHVLVF